MVFLLRVILVVTTHNDRFHYLCRLFHIIAASVLDVVTLLSSWSASWPVTVPCGMAPAGPGSAQNFVAARLVSAHCCYAQIIGSDQTKALNIPMNRLAEVNVTTTVSAVRKRCSHCRNKATLEVWQDGCWIDHEAHTCGFTLHYVEYSYVEIARRAAWQAVHKWQQLLLIKSVYI